ncbi:hypothetical protein [Terriglobus sp.]|uniref:hypothetical protein n=1 Tax=Terriglobus sp. TaxID=1889013 RepID=UPI003AFFBA0A
MYIEIQLIPIQLQTVANFTAPDPWNGSVPAQWKLSVYRMTAENNRALYAKYSAEKQLESADGQNLDREDVLGIRSSVDGLYHILPVALVRLWQQGRVPNAQLPALIAALEPRLKRKDFYDPAAGQRWPRYIAYGMAGFGALIAAVGAWLFISSLSSGSPGMFGMFGVWACLGVAVLYGVIAAVLLQRISLRERKVAAQEAEFATLLPGGGSVFPGRPV